MLKKFESFKSLSEWLSYIRTLHPEEIHLSLDRIKSLAQAAGLLNFDCPIVLVGGTNGKGSTVSALAALLRASGLRVGAYFSPHLFRFNERIVLNGECIQDEVLCECFFKIEQIRQQQTQVNKLTVFEFVTLAALQFFKEAQCDIMILEVGLGGRLDAVNVLEPSLSILTTLGLDHTDRLGDTLDKIAFEKAGIFRPNKPALIGQGACYPALLNEARRLGSVILQEGVDFGWKTLNSWRYNEKIFSIPAFNLPSASLSLALAAFSYLSPLSVETIAHLEQVLREAVLPGRFQRYFNKIETILDVAHNPQGAQWLNEKLATQNMIGVWSSFKDKDLKGIVAAIQNSIQYWVIAPLCHERAATLEELRTTLEDQGIHSTCIFCESTLASAYKKAYSLASAEDKIVVFGSFYTVSEVMCSLSSN